MEIRNYINGNFINSLSEQNIRVINPSNQSTVGFIDAFNLPGGGYKKSGYGRDGGIDSLYSYGQTKRVSKRIQ